MARTAPQRHLLRVPTSWADPREWMRRAANTINGLLSGGPYPYLWKDYLSSLGSAKVGANQPTWATFIGGLEAYSFSKTVMEECFVSFHIQHDIALGPDCKIYPHIHWTANSADTGVCRWGFEYSYAKGHQQGAGSVFPSTTTIYVNQAFSGTAYEHHIAEVADNDAINVSAAGIEVDGVISMRVFRDAANVADTFDAEVFGLFIDLHVQVERLGTVSKSPDFFTP